MFCQWRERIKQDSSYDSLECPRYECTMQLAEIWDPEHGHIWMRRWLETHRMRKAARRALERIRREHHRYRQLVFDFNNWRSPSPTTYSRFPRVLNATCCGVPVSRF